MIPVVSVVIPVFNTSAYLEGCLDSVLGQTLKEIEVICVDDGSTDSSMDILRARAAQDSRLVVLQQKNQGAGPARNNALAHAKGEFVAFMDSDDRYPHQDTLQMLVHAAREHQAEVAAGYRVIMKEDGFEPEDNDPIYRLAQNYPEGKMVKYQDVQTDFNYQCYLFRRDLILRNGLTFPDYRRYQDPPFFVQAMAAAQRFYLLPQPTYVYRLEMKKVNWDFRKVGDLLRGLTDNLSFSGEHQLGKLHVSTLSRLENRYTYLFVEQLKQGGLFLLPMMLYAAGQINLDLVQQQTGKVRENPSLHSMPELLSAAAAGLEQELLSGSRTLAQIMDELNQAFAETVPEQREEYTQVMFRLLVNLFTIQCDADAREKLGICQINHQDTPERALAAIRDVYDELHRQGIYDTFSDTFVSAALSASVSVLETVSETSARYGVLEHLQSPSYLEMDLLGHQLEDYQDKLTYLNANTISSAIAQYAKTCRDRKHYAPELVCPCRGGENIFVSVVVPVYHTEAYVEQTLRSIMDQTLREIEIICVDDGSEDGSLQVLKRLAGEDGRISVYHQENCGLSVTRNVGIERAKGQYIYFMDSDDLLSPDALEQLYRTSTRQQLDTLFFDADSFFETQELAQQNQNYLTLYTRTERYEGVFTGQELFRQFVNNRDYVTSACLQFNRTDFLREHGIRFHPGILHEDNPFTFEVLLKAERAGHLPMSLFHRRVRNDSIMTRQTRFANTYGYYAGYLDMLQVYFELKGHLDQETEITVLRRVSQAWRNARSCYVSMPEENQGSMFGLEEDYFLFSEAAKDWKVDQIHREAKAKLQQTLQEIRDKLQETYAEKSEINAKLQQTYAEKSEINAKLQRTYGEKSQRGAEIQKLKQQLRQMEQEQKALKKTCQSQQIALKQTKAKLKQVKQSLPYRLGRILTWPVRKLKHLMRRG